MIWALYGRGARRAVVGRIAFAERLAFRTAIVPRSHNDLRSIWTLRWFGRAGQGVQVLSFSEQFMANRGKPIDVAGKSVVPAFWGAVRGGDRVRIIWRRSIPEPVQGICMLLKGGAFEVAGRDLKQPVIWRDTAPDEAVVTCKPKRVGDICVWNCWRDTRGVTQAWIGNAGMRISVSGPSSWTIACKSRSEITFDDVVFDLVLEPFDSSAAHSSSREP